MAQSAFALPELEERLHNFFLNGDDVAVVFHWLVFQYKRNDEGFIVLNLHGASGNVRTKFAKWLNETFSDVKIYEYGNGGDIPKTGIYIIDDFNQEGVVYIEHEYKENLNQGKNTVFLTFSQTEKKSDSVQIYNFKMKDSPNQPMPSQ